MADNDQSVSFEDHGSFFSFRAYITIPGVTRETVIPYLVHPDADDDTNVLTEVRLGETAQSLIQHHRDNTPITRNSDIHPRLFIIIDSADFHERGVMLVALQEYHGYNDAVRGPIEDIRDQLMSLSIANDDWSTMKQVSDGDNPKAVPIRRFTAYNLHSDEATFDTAFRKLDDGLQDVYVSDDEDDMASEDGVNSSEDEGNVGGQIGSDEDGEWEEVDEDEEREHDFYKAFKPEVRDLDQVIDRHASHAKVQQQDPEMFAVIDEEYEAQGVLIVRVSPGIDSFRCKGEVAGEILKWIFIGFMTWDEAKPLSERRDEDIF